MSQFFKDVRVVQILGDASPSPSKDQPEASASVQIDSNTGKITVHKQHSDGDGFLAVPICAIVFTFIYLIVKAVMAPFTQRAKDRRAAMQSGGGGGGGLTQEEVAVLHKLQRTLSQMESRVEALETILIEQARTEKNYGSKL